MTVGTEPTAAQLASYRERGMLFPLPALSPDEVRAFRAPVDELLRLAGPEPPPQLFGQCHLNFSWAHELATRPQVLNQVERVLGPDILVHSTTLFAKPPGTGFVSWHQDSAYWGLSEPALVSAWIALSESSVQSGCLRVVPATQHALFVHSERPHPDNMLGTGVTVERGFDEALAVDVELKPGQMSFHHANLLHGSRANRSQAPRIGFAIRYLSAHVTQSRAHHAVTLARGRNTAGHFDLAAPPTPGSVAQGLERQRAYGLSRESTDLDKDGPIPIS